MLWRTINCFRPVFVAPILLAVAFSSWPLTPAWAQAATTQRSDLPLGREPMAGVTNVVFVVLIVGLLVILGVAILTWRWQQKRRAAYVVWGSHTGEPFATLILEQSDTLEAGRRFDLHKAVTTLGRSANNDIIVPDQPVSRLHVEFREQGGNLTLTEVKNEQNGKLMPPRYGTFVNNAPVPAKGRPLKHGDRIRLGSRTVLRLERLEPTPKDATFDGRLTSDRTLAHLSAAAVQDNDATRQLPEEAPFDIDNTRQLDPAVAPSDPTRPRLYPDDSTREIPETANDALSDSTRELPSEPDEDDLTDSTRELP